jgi:hypothetical protein
MFEIKKQVINWNGEFYIIKRTIKESTINEEIAHEYKEYLCADTILRQNGIYYFVIKIEEAVEVEEDKFGE